MPNNRLTPFKHLFLSLGKNLGN